MRRLLHSVLVLSTFAIAAGCGDDDGGTSSSGTGGAGGQVVGGMGGTAGEGGAGAGGSGAAGADGGGGAAPIICDDPSALTVLLTPPALLSETGLYDDIAGEVLASYIEEFVPAYELWSDGVQKARFVYLPDCVIDTTDMDHWSFPVGTRLWKEFRVAGELVETRLIHRHGPSPDDFFYAAYQWELDGSDASYLPGGVVDANGTAHDIPDENGCISCHQGLTEHVLGFGAIQLSHAGPGLTTAGLSAAGRLSHPAPGNFTVPGNAIEAAALGTLHANCGGCHNPALSVFTGFSMRLSVEHTAVTDTHAFSQAVGVVPDAFFGPNVTHRIAPGDPTASAISYRMGVRQQFVQMPPLGTEIVDDAGLAAVDAWIVALGN